MTWTRAMIRTRAMTGIRAITCTLSDGEDGALARRVQSGINRGLGILAQTLFEVR
jgi:hypothetical protein